MKILFDQGTPAPLRHARVGHSVSTAFEMGWSQLNNGDLLDAAEHAFDVFVTTDQNLQFQQNLAGRTLGILVLPTTSWPKIQQNLSTIINAVAALKAGDLTCLTFAS